MLIWITSESQLKTIYFQPVAPECTQGNFPEANRIFTALELGGKPYANFTFYYYLVLFLVPIILMLFRVLYFLNTNFYIRLLLNYDYTF